MQLNKITDYAIRMILYLSQAKQPAPVSVLSEAIGIGKKSLLAAAAKLKTAKLITGHMGVSGGYTLLRAPKEISLLDIMEATEGKTKINGCLEQKKCYYDFPVQRCPVHRVYDNIQSYMEQQFAKVTVQSLLDESEGSL